MYIAKRLSSNTVLCLQQHWDQCHPVHLTDYVLGQKIKVAMQLLAITILLLKKRFRLHKPRQHFYMQFSKVLCSIPENKTNQKTQAPPTHLPS